MNKMNDKEAIIEYLGHKAKFIFPDCYMSFRDIFAQNFELTRSECDKMKITVTANSGDSYKIENDFDYLLFYAEYKGSQDEFYLKVEIENNERNERLERKKRIIEKINNEVSDYIKTSKVHKVNNEIVDYCNNDEYDAMLKKKTQQAENEMKEKMLKLLEVEKNKLKHNLIEKLNKENKTIIDKVTNELIDVDNKRQVSMIAEISNLPVECNKKDEVVHQGIKCMLCDMNPIKGIRYQCSQCPDYNLCGNCEEKNYEKKTHPHNFIMIRKPKDNTKYSYKLINYEPSFYIKQGIDKQITITIQLKNNLNETWINGHTKLICNKQRSTITCEDIMLPSLKYDETTKVKCTFKNLITIPKPTTIKSYLNFVVNDKIYGEPIEVQFFFVGNKRIVNENVALFRSEYNLSINEYPDILLCNLLMANNNNNEEAINNLYSDNPGFSIE